MTNTSGLIQTIVESATTPESAIQRMQEFSKAASEWAASHRTAVTLGNHDHVQPVIPTDSRGAVVVLERRHANEWAGTFDTLLGSFLVDVLSDPAETRVWVRSYADDDSKIVNLHQGTLKSFDDDDITFYDDVAIPRANILSVGV
jgi:hypothetical protein